MTSASRLSRLAPEAAATARLALPIVAGQLLAVALNVIDTVLAGRLGTTVLAAVAMGYQAWVLALLVVIGVLFAVSPAVAQLDGAGYRAAVGPVFRQALWLGIAIGLLLMAGLRQAQPLLELARVDPAIIPDALDFLRAIAWGAPALALFFVCKNTSEGLSLTRPTMYFSALGVVVLLPVAYVLMYGKLGVPALGAAGAGYAHAITLWVEALAFLVYLKQRRHYRDAGLYTRFERPDPRAIGGLLKVGVPMGIAIMMEGGLFVAVALLAGRLGEVTAAAHQIAINVASIAFMLPLGIGMATTVRVGNAVGRGDARGVAWAGAAGLALTLACQLLSIAAMVGAPRAIVAAYTADAAVAALAGSLLLYAAVFQISDGIQAFVNGALRGLKDAALPALITALAYWGIGFPLSWWLGLGLGGGAPGLWTGFIAGLSTAALLLGLRFVVLARRLRRDGVPEVVHPAATRVRAAPAAGP
jgi:MATE family multidrug resistance protein